MFYTIYKITNEIDGKIYIGKHQTNNLDDGYMGSGKILRHAISKYGIENFTKEILFQFDNEIDMNTKEAELVTEEFCDRRDTYNLCPGGHGGFGYINNSYWNETNNHIRIRPLLAMTSEQRAANARKTSQLNIGKKKSGNGRLGTKLPQSTIDKLRKPKSKTENYAGSSNSQFGTMWITDGIENKKVSKESILPEGWRKGRVTKNASMV